MKKDNIIVFCKFDIQSQDEDFFSFSFLIIELVSARHRYPEQRSLSHSPVVRRGARKLVGLEQEDSNGR